MLPDLSTLMQQCAPNVGQVTMRALIKTESAGNPYILADAGPAHLPWSKREHLVRTIRPQSAAEAAHVVRGLLAQGHKVAIGLTQVEAGNLPKLGLTIEQVLEPCTNIKAGSQILTQNYRYALRKLGGNDPQAALQAALSLYWSGDLVRGFQGGYVQKVISNAGLPLELKVPNIAGRRGTSAPLMVASVSQARSRYSAQLQPAGFDSKKTVVDPRYAPLAAAGFGPAAAPN